MDALCPYGVQGLMELQNRSAPGHQNRSVFKALADQVVDGTRVHSGGSQARPGAGLVLEWAPLRRNRSAWGGRRTW